MLLLTAGLAAAGLILSGIGAAMWSGRIPQNPIVGFRTPRTLADPEIWLGANRVAGRDLVLSGVLTSVMALVQASVVPGGVPIEDVHLLWLLLPVLPLVLFVPVTMWRVSAWVADHDAAARTAPPEPLTESPDPSGVGQRRPASRVEER